MAVVGVITAIAVPLLTNVSGETEKVVITNNAIEADTVSTGLAVEGVAHVLPESLGGKEGTLRFMKVGITVQREGRQTTYGLPSLPEKHITPVAQLVEPVFDTAEVRLDYRGEDATDGDQAEFTDYLIAEIPSADGGKIGSSIGDPAAIGVPEVNDDADDDVISVLSKLFEW